MSGTLEGPSRALYLGNKWGPKHPRQEAKIREFVKVYLDKQSWACCPSSTLEERALLCRILATFCLSHFPFLQHGVSNNKVSFIDVVRPGCKNSIQCLLGWGSVGHSSSGSPIRLQLSGAGRASANKSYSQGSWHEASVTLYMGLFLDCLGVFMI